MISSISCVFMITCYAYFKQLYTKLIDSNVTDADQRKVWNTLLTKKLVIFPLGVVIVVILYACSFTIIHLAPTLENVKLIRRIADLVTVMICATLFFLDKLQMDKKLAAMNPTPNKDSDEDVFIGTAASHAPTPDKQVI